MSIEQQSVMSAKTAGEAAALWWVSVLGNPKLDNGDNGGAVLAAIAAIVESEPEQPLDSLNQFAIILAERLDQKLAEDHPSGYLARCGITLRVDYHPDALLSECAESAGLMMGMTHWPWKTTMWVKNDEVMVRYGYGAREEIVWAKIL